MKTLFKESVVSVKKNFKRFLSILLIVLLGVGFFAGIKATSPDMKNTIDKYYRDTNFMDFNLISTWGIKDNDLEKLKGSGYDIQGNYEFDAIVKGETEEVIKILSYDKNDKINKVVLLDGRLPSKKNECLIEQSEYTKSHKIGDKITVEDDNLREKTLDIVGIIKSPIFTSLERGTTKLLSGKVNFFMYVPKDNFNIDYYTSAYVKLNNNLSTFSTEYEDIIVKKAKEFEKLTESISEVRYNEEIEKANKEIKDSEDKLNDEKEKYNKEIEKAEEKINNAKKEYNNGLKKFNYNKEKAYSELLKNEEALKDARKRLEKEREKLNKSKKEYQQHEKEYQTTLKTLNQSIKEIDAGLEEIDTNLDTLYNTKATLEQLISNNIEVTKNRMLLEDVNNNIKILTDKKEKLISKRKEVSKAIDKINNAKKMLEDADDLLTLKEKELSKNETTFKQTKKSTVNSLNQAKRKLDDAYKKIVSNSKKIEISKKEAKAKFEDAEIQIKNAKRKVEDLKKPTWYILDRNSNPGFYQYDQDTERIKNVGKLFPLVFFVVAILICLTSMTRMVEEERGQIGTLKALGYDNVQIASKYVIYALLATIIGSIIGVLIGFRILPSIIFNMYSMMYNVGKIIIQFNWYYALTGTLIAIFCTVAATLFACYRELKESPAALMRPKSPKAGKRVLLERIKFIWNRLSFTRKVTVRNVFRYKKRFLMTIVGIAGCTGLIIAGFGLRDGITSIVSGQYEKVFNYQIEVTFKPDVTLNEKNNEVERIKRIDKINDVLIANKESVEIKNKNTNQSIQLIVPFSSPDGFIFLKNRTSGEEYKLNNNIVVSEKLSKLLILKKGDKLRLKTDKEYIATIGGITENYFLHYIYMDKKLYDSSYYNTLFIKTDNLTDEEEKVLATEIKKNDTISNISFTSSTRNVFDSTMKNFALVALVLVVSAGLLAFVVLYNLANVNISERIRELATIKVLGFYDREVYNYVGRETTILTGIGMFFGILIGKALTVFILKTCELDQIMFGTTIKIQSYIYSLLLTVVFTLLVNITTYFALKKVDMIESLKSIE
mgnify:FL=1